MAKKQVDAEQLVDNLQNAKFGLSIQNIVAIVTVLSSLIAGWYTFTGRIDSLEEVVQGFAETSDIELVVQKLDAFEKDIDYLKNKLFAALKIPKAYLGYEEQVNGKATLAAEDVRFARTIERIQRIVIS